MMENVGLDTVESIEEHYVKERGLSHDSLDWFHKTYVATGRLGNKTPGKGGLYPVPPPGTQTKILLLNIGLGKPIGPKDTPTDLLHKGQILSVNPDNGKATEILGNQYTPDGIGKCDHTLLPVYQLQLT